MDKQTLIDNMNKDLANELSAIIQYITYAAKATGPYRPQLSAFFLTEVTDEQGHALFLANKIVALGGEPTTMAAPVPPANSALQARRRYALFHENGGGLLNVIQCQTLHREPHQCEDHRP